MRRLVLAFLFITIAGVVHARTTVVANRPVSSGGGSTCANCETNLVQAFILDDGTADLTDWAGTNNLTLDGTNPPSWGSSNSGLVFDGTNDLATFTPASADWQAGYSIAIKCTVPNTQSRYIAYLDNSGSTAQRVYVGSDDFSAFNRMQGGMGRDFSNNEALVQGCGSGDSTEQWYFWQYDGTGTASMYKNSASATCDTDASISEFGTVSFNRGRLGVSGGGSGFAATTIKRILFYNAPLTQTQRQELINGELPTHN